MAEEIKDKNGNANGRVTTALIGQKLDMLAEGFHEHATDGRDVLTRLATLEGKVQILLWGVPILFTLAGILIGVLKVT